MHLTLNLAIFQTLHWTGAAAVPTEAEAAPSLMESPRVLVVHADDQGRGALHFLLNQQGFLISEARSGSEALDLAGRLRPDILLFRLSANCDGPRTIGVLRSAPNVRDAPIIVVAALSDVTALEGCLAAGASDFVLTPVEWPELHLRLRLHLARAHRQVEALPIREVWA
jgi:PleD family two-component response regulator